MFVKVNNSKFEVGQVVLWDHSPLQVDISDKWKEFDGAFIVANGGEDIYEVVETPVVTAAIRRGYLVETVLPEVAQEEVSVPKRKKG